MPAKKDRVTIKDMPTYDPDAEISSLYSYNSFLD